MDNTTAKNRGFRDYLGTTFLIGFGFFTMGLMDPLYDTYVPFFLRRYIDSNAGVGGIMTLDNLLQLFLIPVISIWSDRTRTRLGRRLPFILVMLPLSAILFRLIPTMAARSFLALVGILFCFNTFKTSVRGPVVALMPDTIPGDYRSEANGVINMMGGIGLIVGTIGLAPLISRNETLPFLIAGICIIAATLVLLIFVREKLPEDSGEAEEKGSLVNSFKTAFSAGNASVARILIAIFFWFMAYEGAKPFLGLYMVSALGVSEGMAALAQGTAGISSVILALPSGLLAHRMGRRNFIRLCLIILSVIMFLIPLANLVVRRQSLSQQAGLILFLALMFLYGAVWIGVVVNSFPMLWQMAAFGTMGIYTGLYYTFSQSAAILAPPITGLVSDLAGYHGIFIFGSLCMLAAFFVMAGVSAGEPGEKSAS
jgi:MFS family permease